MIFRWGFASTIILLLGILSATADSTSAISIAQTIPTVKQQPVAVLPFDFIDGEVLLTVKINNSETSLRFALDSGATNSTINTHTAEQLQLRLRDPHLFSFQGMTVRIRQKAGGYGSKAVSLKEAEHVRVKIVAGTGVVLASPPAESDAITLNNTRYDVLPLGNLSDGKPVDGVLGFELLHQYVVTIDYANRTVAFYEPKSFVYTRGGHSVPIKLDTQQPSVQAIVKPLGSGEPFRVKLLLDTWDEGDQSFHTPFVEDKKLLKTGINTQLAVIGTGVGGSVMARTGHLESFSLGDFTISRPTTRFYVGGGGEAGTKDRDGGLGNEIWKRFTLTLDFPYYRIFIEPNADFAASFAPLYYSGMLWKKTSDGCTVLSVETPSPAATSGFQKDDLFIAIDDQSLTTLSPQAVIDLIQNDDPHRYTVKRGTQMLALTLQNVLIR